MFNKCTIGPSDGTRATKGGSYLGRPWRPYSSVVFQQTYISDLINPAGWSKWDDTRLLGNVFYREFKNTGPGAAGPRASFSGTLDKKEDLKTFFGKKDWPDWVDKEYFKAGGVQ